MTEEWVRSPTCEASSCAEWQLVGELVKIRSSERPGLVAVFTLKELEDFVRSYQAGEVV